jgi:hypothetical protein
MLSNGLGLSLVNGIVKVHDATLELSDTGPGLRVDGLLDAASLGGARLSASADNRAGFLPCGTKGEKQSLMELRSNVRDGFLALEIIGRMPHGYGRRRRLGAVVRAPSGTRWYFVEQSRANDVIPQ